MKEIIHSIFAIFGILMTIFLVWYLICPEVKPNCFLSIIVGSLAVFIEDKITPNK